MNRFIISTALAFALAASASAEENQKPASDEATQADVAQAEPDTEAVDVSKLSWMQKTKLRRQIDRCREEVGAELTFDGKPKSDAYDRDDGSMPDVYTETKHRLYGKTRAAESPAADDPISRMSPECQQVVRTYEPALYPRRYR